MGVFFDWLLIIISTFIVLLSYKRIIFKKNTSVANYIISIIYIFCVLPIVLNYFIGMPKYNTAYWYKPFISAMQNNRVNIIYDIYIMALIILLYTIFGRRSNVKGLKKENTLTSIYRNNKIISIVLILSPIILIILTGTWKNYLIYNISSARGVSGTVDAVLMTSCLLISVITYFSVVFKKNIGVRKVLFSILYFVLIIWISGKRFMIANILVLVIFYVVNMNLKSSTRKRMYIIIPLLCSLLVGFSAFYLMKVRPMSETSFDSVYDMLRVDFGRDDVIKYVINEEIINNNMILDYRGESFISLIASFIPREMWPNKPYPHYMYLTASILSVDKLNIPAGTTPSLLEMVICNFGFMGFPIGIGVSLILCAFIDKCTDIDRKAIYLLVFIVLLTQSMDVYLIAIVLLVLMRVIMILFKNKLIKFVWK